MNNENYVVATIKPWNIKVYNEIIKHYPGVWHLITDHILKGGSDLESRICLTSQRIRLVILRYGTALENTI